MRLALDEAAEAVRGGDVPVGAVVLAPDGTTVLAAGHNEREACGDPTAHAEVLALR
ncbi:deaminase, partial [Streptomyces sp. NRRL S-481]